ncbi:MAG TPA: beta-galactosidase [Patescibacteria group bacterium]|nr:beta-galactosidase [Patescibacteria group bacterium]
MHTVSSILKTGVIILICLLFVAFVYFFVGWPQTSRGTDYGITWSKPYAEFLGLNVNDGLRAALADFGIKQVRIPVYWPYAEPQKGKYDWSWLDQQMTIISQAGAKAILVVGVKQPRWPECWVPDWLSSLSANQRTAERFAYIQAVLDRYGKNSAVLAWQVENEPDFSFGTCDPVSRNVIASEMNLVKTFEERNGTNRPIFTTASGELSSWLGYAGKTDGIGVSVYRNVISPWGIFHYPFPSWFYARKAALVRPFAGMVYVSEFQMEPWVKGNLPTMSLEEQFKTFSLASMKDNFVYASRLNFPWVDFWGAEWWYWMKTQKNHPEFWETAKIFFQSQKHS